MMQTIENDVLKVEINELGAELTSIVDKSTGFNYIWEDKPKVWPKHAPNLFPAIGRSMNEHYLVNGQRYEMPQHGIGFFHHYVAEKLAANCVKFTMHSDEETHQYYPFDFTFTIQFELHGKSIRMIDTVENPNDETLSFAVGTHPAWNIPMKPNERFEDYYLTFGTKPKKLTYHEFMFDNGAPLRTGKILELQQYDGERLPLTRDLFKNGLIVFNETNKLNRLELHSTKGSQGITVHFRDFPQLCIWTQSDERASFLCLEPFYGVSDQYGQEVELMDKVGNYHMAAHELRTFTIDYDIND